MKQYIKIIIIPLLLVTVSNIQTKAQCTEQFVDISSFNGQNNTANIFANNNIGFGGSRILVTHPFGSSMLTTDRVSDNHYPGEYGINLGHSSGSNAANTFDRRIETQLEFVSLVRDFKFTINDLDAGDRIRVLAYDQNNNLISITSSNYSFYPNTVITYFPSTGLTGEFRSTEDDMSSGPSGQRRATIDFTFPDIYLSRIVFQYYDVNSSGTYSIAKFSGIDGEACPPCNAGIEQVPLDGTILTN